MPNCENTYDIKYRAASRLKAARKEAEISQEEAAGWVSRPRSWLSQVENVRVSISIEEYTHLMMSYLGEAELFDDFKYHSVDLEKMMTVIPHSD